MAAARRNRILSSQQILVTFTATLSIFLVNCCAKSVHKRSAVQMCNLISHHTQMSCLNFNDYGCFCGYGQSGGQALDDVDNCCRLHDDCYGNFNDCFMLAQFYHYSYTCKEATRQCQCTSTWTCFKRACECDIELARCLRGAYDRGHYDPRRKNYDLTQCHATPYLD